MCELFEIEVKRTRVIGDRLGILGLLEDREVGGGTYWLIECALTM